MNNIQSKLDTIKTGFKSLAVEDQYKEKALSFLKQWLTNEEFADYVPQIDYLIEQENWDLLLDCFYQVISFGTGGRRGPVGIGPNRINIWTIQASAQGHSQYLIAKHGEEAKQRGVVIAYDVRAYTNENEYDNSRPNPVANLSGKVLAQKAAEVYTANGILVYTFSDFTSTPELSFMVRHLNAIAGDQISASHNPPEFNGKKVVDSTGGQLVAPDDQELVDVVVNEVKQINTIDLKEAETQGLLKVVSEAEHEAYIEAACSMSQNAKYRSAKILFSPFHGTTYKSVPEVFSRLGFDLVIDEASRNPDPQFPTLMFNIPNPEVEESYQNLIPVADKNSADIILVTDPDGDRIGVMSKEKTGWRFYNGNEIGILMTAYMLEELKEQHKLNEHQVILKTVVTSNLISVLGESYGIEIIPDLLVGIKYVGDIMNKMEAEGRIEDFLLGIEESNGSSGGNYVRDKDFNIPGILIAELASKCKDNNLTLGQYLDEVFKRFGYYRNYLTEIRLPGAEGMSQMAKIMAALRTDMPEVFGKFKVEKITDRLKGEPIKSETDAVSRNVLIMDFVADNQTRNIQVTVRPSGTEPKTKFYFEIGRYSTDDLEAEKNEVEALKDELEREIVKHCYKIIGIDFPDRGFLLFWQLPAQTKLKYFEIEPKLAALKDIPDKETRKTELANLLKFLGADPVAKVDKAFQAKYKAGINEYLELA